MKGKTNHLITHSFWFDNLLGIFHDKKTDSLRKLDFLNARCCQQAHNYIICKLRMLKSNVASFRSMSNFNTMK